MKIALFTDGIYPYVMGGMQKHSFYLAKFLASKGVEIDLYHTYKSKSDLGAAQKLHLFTEAEKERVNSYVIPPPPKGFLPGHYLKESYQYSIDLYKRFKENDEVDFIYAKGFAAWKLIAEKKKGESLPPIAVKFHGMEMFQKSTSFMESLEHWMFRGPVRYNLRNADYVFSYGGRITELTMAEGVEASSIIDVPTGIDPEWLISEQEIKSIEEPIHFLFVGRNERRKGMKELKLVLEELISENIDFKMSFIGPIPRTQHILDSRLTYHGVIKDADKMKSIVRKADCLLCPSYAEGMPNVIMESMASGLAIIASDVGAVNQMVDKSNGMLIIPASKASLKDALLHMIREPGNIANYKLASVRKVNECFLWPDIAQQTLDGINDILSKEDERTL